MVSSNFHFHTPIFNRIQRAHNAIILCSILLLAHTSVHGVRDIFWQINIRFLLCNVISMHKDNCLPYLCLHEGLVHKDVSGAALITFKQGGRKGAVKKILDFGLDLNLQSTDYDSPLHVACICGHLGIVRILLARGANPNKQSLVGTSPLDSTLSAPNITAQKKLVIIQELLTHDIDTPIKNKAILLARTQYQHAQDGSIEKQILTTLDPFGNNPVHGLRAMQLTGLWQPQKFAMENA